MTAASPSSYSEEKTVYVLWVRHCESCTNANLQKTMFLEPLCTERGVIQSLMCGNKLVKTFQNPSFEKDVDETDYSKMKYNFYSSYLPRAMETSKLLSHAFVKNNFTTSKTVKRLPYVSEFYRRYESTSRRETENTTTKEASDLNALLINQLFKQH